MDENGNPVVSKLNEEELRNIAAGGRGSYTLLRNTDDAANKLADEMTAEQDQAAFAKFRKTASSTVICASVREFS